MPKNERSRRRCRRFDRGPRRCRPIIRILDNRTITIFIGHCSQPCLVRSAFGAHYGTDFGTHGRRQFGCSSFVCAGPPNPTTLKLFHFLVGHLRLGRFFRGPPPIIIQFGRRALAPLHIHIFPFYLLSHFPLQKCDSPLATFLHIKSICSAHSRRHRGED